MYLDIAIGLFIGLLVAFFSGDHHLSLVVMGVAAALAPDIDFAIYLIRHRFQVDQYAHEHRDLLHMPLIFSGGGALLLGHFFPLYGIIWGLGTLWHFIHDTFDGGWGIRWLHPFSGGYFTMAKYSSRHYFKNKKEQRKVAGKCGNPRWLQEGYLTFNPRLMAELAALIIALGSFLFWYFS